ncbi:MAG: RidA family protein [Gammaproteobacteria bacterium]|nr:RidA family protein [Gammaproteobacteria bacterium]
MARNILPVFVYVLAGLVNAQEIQRINPDGMTQPTAYTHVVRYGDILYLAGQVSTDAEGNVIGEGDMRAQVRQVLENMKTVLASQGADFDDVVKITIYTTDIDAYRRTGDIRSEYWTGGAPASTLVQIDRLARPVFLVEIEATAIAPN